MNNDRRVDEAAIVRWLAEDDWTAERGRMLAAACMSLFRALREAQKGLDEQAKAFARILAAKQEEAPGAHQKPLPCGCYATDAFHACNGRKMGEPVHAAELVPKEAGLEQAIFPKPSRRTCNACPGEWNSNEMEAHMAWCPVLKKSAGS